MMPPARFADNAGNYCFVRVPLAWAGSRTVCPQVQTFTVPPRPACIVLWLGGCLHLDISTTLPFSLRHTGGPSLP